MDGNNNPVAHLKEWLQTAVSDKNAACEIWKAALLSVFFKEGDPKKYMKHHQYNQSNLRQTKYQVARSYK